MERYRSRVVEIEAMELTVSNQIDVEAWITETHEGCFQKGDGLDIPTLEGTMHASVGDFIIKGLEGEFYPCKPSVFNAKYDIIKK